MKRIILPALAVLCILAAGYLGYDYGWQTGAKSTADAFYATWEPKPEQPASPCVVIGPIPAHGEVTISGDLTPRRAAVPVFAASPATPAPETTEQRELRQGMFPRVMSPAKDYVTQEAWDDWCRRQPMGALYQMPHAEEDAARDWHGPPPMPAAQVRGPLNAGCVWETSDAEADPAEMQRLLDSLPAQPKEK